METVELVLKTITGAGKALKTGEIAVIAGIEKAEVDKAIKKLKKEERVYSPKVCFYDVKR